MCIPITIEQLVNYSVYNLQVISGPNQSCSHMMDVCDGKLFKSHETFKKCPNALQVIAYYDEVVIVNPLSPKAKEHKLG